MSPPSSIFMWRRDPAVPPSTILPHQVVTSHWWEPVRGDLASAGGVHRPLSCHHASGRGDSMSDERRASSSEASRCPCCRGYIDVRNRMSCSAVRHVGAAISATTAVDAGSTGKTLTVVGGPSRSADVVLVVPGLALTGNCPGKRCLGRNLQLRWYIWAMEIEERAEIKK